MKPKKWYSAATMSINTEQRREMIYAETLRGGRITIKQLALQLDVSEATVRRDIKALAKEGKVEQVLGGAVLPRTIDFSFRTKETRNIEAKRIIGRLAARLVSDGDVIYLDSGTTCFAMTPFLKEKRDLSIIANSARLALELDCPGIEVILLGGTYRPDRLDTVGPLALATLDQLRGYTAFIGADGLGTDFGVTAGDVESAALYRLAVDHARRNILVADHSKFLSPSLVKIVDFGAIDCVVTDRRPAGDWMEFLSSVGLEVIYPTDNEHGEVPHGESP